MNPGRVVSGCLDMLVVPGFSRIGYQVRSRIGGWQRLEEMSMRGRTVVLTGPTSGLGRAAADALAQMGAHLVLVARSRGKCEAVAAELAATHPNCTAEVVVADMSDLAAVGEAARGIAASHGRIDVLVHNAGALTNERCVSPQGFESTIATHVLGPHLMTRVLMNAIRSANGRVVTVSSGGMYLAALPRIGDGRTPEMSEERYDGTKQYAVAKRVQVTLNEMWATREPSVSFHSMHPGWADTPGVRESIPGFRRLTRPILRSPAEGADTIVWLAAVSPAPGASGRFWCDREPRSIHRTGATRRSDTEQARAALWAWCDAQTDSWMS